MSANNSKQIMKYGNWGAWGDIVFKTMESPTSFSDSRKWRVQAQAVINGYPQHQYTGEDERIISLSITLHNEFTDLTIANNDLNAQANTEIAQPMVIGHRVLGFFKCRSLDHSYDDTTQEGVLIASTYRLTLVEVRE
ncbi:phage tail protein [Photobacterium damselae subsp. damselae]|uniref:phage tail protein n=1 Tax=Photobacterium damselae TaxID=38293 RepID=UPI001F3D54D5|nr:phage tail protein [Photobacterium damselae]UJZ95039.1 phage tail protein [Photobacterium damselae subsp. damselae]UJZ99020.1 phage tail protein [Photobacterium damselae subsp. damselae]